MNVPIIQAIQADQTAEQPKQDNAVTSDEGTAPSSFAELMAKLNEAAASTRAEAEPEAQAELPEAKDKKAGQEPALVLAIGPEAAVKPAETVDDVKLASAIKTGLVTEEAAAETAGNTQANLVVELPQGVVEALEPIDPGTLMQALGSKAVTAEGKSPPLATLMAQIEAASEADTETVPDEAKPAASQISLGDTLGKKPWAELLRLSDGHPLAGVKESEVASSSLGHSTAQPPPSVGPAPAGQPMSPGGQAAAPLDTAPSGPGVSHAPPPVATLHTLGEETIRSVRYLAKSGEKTITVRLVPESLGQVHLEVRSSGDHVAVRLVSAHPAVRDTLDAQIHALRDALIRDGIDVGKIEVASNMLPNAGAGGQANRGMERQEAFPPPRFAASNPSVNTAPSAVSPRQRAGNHAGALNVFV